MKGDLKTEVEILTIQSIVAEGVERDELKDEIFVQLMRQTNNNPVRDACLRLWVLLCLCVIAFHPTKLLQKVWNATCYFHQLSSVLISGYIFDVWFSVPALIPEEQSTGQQKLYSVCSMVPR